MHRPSKNHWSAVKQVLHYLKATQNYGLALKQDTPLLMHAFSDVDWAGNRDDRASTTAYVVFHGANPIPWS